MHITISEAITKSQSKQIATTSDSLNYAIDGDVIITVDGHIICSYLVDQVTSGIPAPSGLTGSSSALSPGYFLV